MDLDGVWTQLGFPNFPRFSGHRFVFAKDKELALACIEAYNDFVVDEWCATNPERYVGLSIVPLWDVDAARAELIRTAEKGAKAVAFSENPTVLGLPSVHTRHWDPLFAAAAEAGMPVCMHIGSSSQLLTTSADAPTSVQLTVLGANSMLTCADWLFSGLFERFPALRVVLSEGGAGWVPYVLERAEKVFGIYGERSGSTRSPLELFREHVFACMVTDSFAVRSLGDVGADNLLWESDYPHDDGMFPNSRACLEAALEHVPDEDAQKIGAGNARQLFRLTAPAIAAQGSDRQR
jgi:predicted TIM-barrel fold metal-dependent hydrolase